MEIISTERINDIVAGKEPSRKPISGVLFLTDYTLSLTKTGKEYITGNLINKTKVHFKAWSNSEAFRKLKVEDYVGMPVAIVGTVDNYNGTGDIILESVTAIEGYSEEQFIEQKYNIEAYFDGLMTIIKKSVSQKGMQIVNKIFEDKDVLNAFKTEYAASSHHDNCRGGLLAHTYKCVSLMHWVLAYYPKVAFVPNSEGILEESKDRIDLLMIGTLFHDIGKIREMHRGVYQNCSKVTHRILGIEFFSPFKDMIVELYGEEWYYDLISILVQHHGDFDDSCRTVVSFVVHKVDCFDSDLTLLAQGIDEQLTRGSSGYRLNTGTSWLTIE